MTMKSEIASWRPQRGRTALLTISLMAALVPAAQAQDYPSRAIRLIVPTGPGGGYDVFGRIVADQLNQKLGQAVVVENKTGAGTILGTKSVIDSQADGYTLPPLLSRPTFSAGFWRAEIANNQGLRAQTSALH